MIYVTHDQVEAMTLADKIVVLKDGEVMQVGAPMDLYHKPANLFVAGFLGAPSMNFIKVKVVHERAAKRLSVGTATVGGVEARGQDPVIGLDRPHATEALPEPATVLRQEAHVAAREDEDLLRLHASDGRAGRDPTEPVGVVEVHVAPDREGGLDEIGLREVAVGAGEPGVVPSAVEVMRLGRELAVDEARHWLERPTHDDVAGSLEKAVLEPRRRVGLEFEECLGVPFGEARHRAGQVQRLEGRHAVDDADAQLRSLAAVHPIHGRLEALEVAQELLRGGIGVLSRRRHAEPAATAFAELRAELGLERGEMGRQCRLRHVERDLCPLEAVAVHDGAEDPDQPEIDVRQAAHALPPVHIEDSRCNPPRLHHSFRACKAVKLSTSPSYIEGA
jgi:hypothetical protein